MCQDAAVARNYSTRIVDRGTPFVIDPGSRRSTESKARRMIMLMQIAKLILKTDDRSPRPQT